MPESQFRTQTNQVSVASAHTHCSSQMAGSAVPVERRRAFFGMNVIRADTNVDARAPCMGSPSSAEESRGRSPRRVAGPAPAPAAILDHDRIVAERPHLASN